MLHLHPLRALQLMMTHCSIPSICRRLEAVREIYLSKIFLGQGDLLYSSKSRVVAEIIEDEVGRHDFLLTPCSKDTFRLIYNDMNPHRGCEENLLAAFAEMGLTHHSLPTTFNLFMNVVIDKVVCE